MPSATLRQRILSLISSPAKQRDYRRRGRVAVGNTSKNACAATASQPLIELEILHRIELMAEGLTKACKRSKFFVGVSNLKLAQPGDLVVCADLNGNGVSDHIWWIVRDLGDGWYECLDNQSSTLTHRRRLDGRDGKTPARGLLQPT
jgi:hypothetical protein